MTEHKIREAMGYLEPALVQEADQPMVHKRRRLQAMLVAACLAALCAISVAAKIYTGWTIGEVTRFDAMEELKKKGWSIEAAPDSFWERDGQYELWPQVEHEAYHFDAVVREKFPRGSGNVDSYFDSVTEMNAQLNLNILHSSLLKQVPGEQLRVLSCYRDGDDNKLYLLGSQYYLLEGHEDIYCSAAFTVYGYSGTDIAFSTGSEKNDYTFSQLEIEKLHVTAECIEQKEQGFNNVTIAFTKDAVNYLYLFSSKEKMDMTAVIAVLESLE